MKKTIVAVTAAACMIASLEAVPAVASTVKDEHRAAVHTGSWTRGHRLSPSDRRRATVFDYGSYRLSTPPHGYHWVRIRGSFLLVGVTSGLILRVVAAR